MEPLYLVVIFGMVIFQFVSLKLGGWLLPFVLGVFGLGVTAATLEGTINAEIPLWPWPSLLLALISTIVIFFAATKLRGDA